MSTSKRLFVDTNIFIYTLFDVNKKKQRACISLFQNAEQGKARLWTSEWVIAEIVWFLGKQNLPWGKIQTALETILYTRGLDVENKQLLEALVVRCLRSRDFIDCLNITHAKAHGISSGYSYDKGLDQADSFTRKEP